MAYNVVIVDDEDVARLRLRRLILDNFDDLRVIAEASNGISGIEIIKKTKPDLVFLDIEMPGISGLDVAQTTCKDIFIIFVTAYDQYVFDAFKTLTVDYILKPIEIDSLKGAIDKFKKMVNPPQFKRFRDTSDLPPVSSFQSKRFRITIGKSTKFIDYNDIAYFEANQKYVEVYTVELKKYLIGQTLQKLETSLPSADFIRIHRKYIVNKKYVGEIKRLGDRKYKLVLKISVERELNVGRYFLSNIKKLK